MSELDARLRSLSMRDLREIASRAGVPPDQTRKRDEIVSRLVSLPNVGEVLKDWELSLPRLLSDKDPAELRDIASKHGVDISSFKKKKDMIAAIVSHPSSTAIAESLRSEKKLNVIRGELEEAKSDIARAVQQATARPEEGVPADPMFRQALSLEVDFDQCEDLLDQTRMRFEEHNFEGALGAAVEAHESEESCRRDFSKSVMAYAILSTQRLVEECGKAGRDVKEATELLRKAEKQYGEGNFSGGTSLLRDMEAVSRSLFSAEVQRARDQIHSAQEVVRDVANLGGDVRRAEDSLNEARDSLRRSEYTASIERAARAVELAENARQDRVRNIEDAIPSTVSIIEEAKHVGADVSDAERLVSKTKTAIASKEYLLASELIKRAERAAMETQQNQIIKAMELRRRQVEKAQGIVIQVEPVIEEADSFGIDTSEAQTLLQQAKEILAEGDYVNGTVFARNAAEVTKRLEPKLVEERIKRGILKPTEGVCASCGSTRLEFTDDGWSNCAECGYAFRWRAPGGVWTRFKSLLKG